VSKPQKADPVEAYTRHPYPWSDGPNYNKQKYVLSGLSSYLLALFFALMRNKERVNRKAQCYTAAEQ